MRDTEAFSYIWFNLRRCWQHNCRYGHHDCIKYRSFVTSAIPAQGTIIDLVQRSSTDRKGHWYYAYYPVIEFTARSGEATVFEWINAAIHQSLLKVSR